VAIDPLHADALHLLAAIEHAAGRSQAAIALLNRAVKLRPDDFQFLNNFGAVLATNGQHAWALEMIHRALLIKPDFAEAYSNLGNALKALGQSRDAEAALRRAIQLRPDYPEAHYNLAAIQLESGNAVGASESLGNAVRLRPNWPDALNNLGSALQSAGRYQDAIKAFREAIAARPDFAEAYSNLGNVLGYLGSWDEAVAVSRVAVTLKPNSADMLSNFGGALRGRGDLDEAVVALDSAMALRPNSPEALVTLALVMKDRGELESSVALFRRALQFRPDPQTAGTLLFTLHYLPESTPQSLWAEHKAWSDTYAAPLASSILAHRNNRDVNRRLRIGYSSGDLNMSPIGRFILPILQHADRDQFESFCYSDTRHGDAMTDRIRAAAGHWRDVGALSDAQLADQVREDQIDILVDLAMHTGRNRMLLFARKPAPVQVTYLTYLGTTGLSTMDYRFTDPYVRDAEGEAAFYCEQAAELARSYWCYDPPAEAGAIGELPANRNGFITFGCLNGFGKVTTATISMWCDILRELPSARLLLHAREGSHRDRLRSTFAAAGCNASNLKLVSSLALDRYFQVYNQIDIALDSFPYPGGTTTCDALWMGVPVVTRVGGTAASRGGRSILSNAGLPNLVATSAEAYVAKAIALANDPSYLTRLRRDLRQQVQSSPLLDASSQTRDIEAAYRKMWVNFCASGG